MLSFNLLGNTAAEASCERSMGCVDSMDLDGVSFDGVQLDETQRSTLRARFEGTEFALGQVCSLNALQRLLGAGSSREKTWASSGRCCGLVSR